MRFIFREAVLPPAVARAGIGHVDPAKAALMMAIAARAFNVATPPPWQCLLRTKFLPPAAERLPPSMRA